MDSDGVLRVLFDMKLISTLKQWFINAGFTTIFLIPIWGRKVFIDVLEGGNVENTVNNAIDLFSQSFWLCSRLVSKSYYVRERWLMEKMHSFGKIRGLRVVLCVIDLEGFLSYLWITTCWL